jgi:hypothetical protein
MEPLPPPPAPAATGDAVLSQGAAAAAGVTQPSPPTDSAPVLQAAAEGAVARVENDGNEDEEEMKTQRQPSLHLALFSFFSDYWLDVHLCILLVLTVPKRLLFVYPEMWWSFEILFLVLAYGARRLQRLLCTFGDHAENVGAIAASLSVSAPVLLLYGYFATLQVYVLRIEFMMGALSIVLLGAEMVLAVIEGMAIASGGFQRTLIIVASFLPTASIALLAVPLVSSYTTSSAESVRILLIIGVSFAGASLPFALVFLGFMLDL